jgi:hypothetical protein
MVSRTLEQRLLDKVLITTDRAGKEHWLWTGAKFQSGYGQIRIGGRGHSKLRRAHVVAFELWRGPVPRGREIDHMCSIRCCINPACLSPATHRANSLRGRGVGAINHRKHWCAPGGHELDHGNTYIVPSTGARECRTCKAHRRRKSADKRRAELRAAR